MPIRFDDQPDVHFVPKVRRFEHVLLWWQGADYQCFKEQNEQTVVMATTSGTAVEDLDNSIDHCLRGLNALPEEQEATEDSRGEAFLAVMQVQKQRRLQGSLTSNNTHALASAYRRAARAAKVRAREIGVQDADIAMREDQKGGNMKQPTERMTPRQKQLKRLEAAAKLRSSFSRLSRRLLPASAPAGSPAAA